MNKIAMTATSINRIYVNRISANKTIMHVQTTNRLKKLTASFLLLSLLWFSGITQSIAQEKVQGLAGVTQTINLYLSSLINGDTQQLIALIGGSMKQKNQQLILNPATYSRFLRQHYSNTKTEVESITPSGDHLQAQVRFDFPTQESTVIKFILTYKNNQWLITDELTDTSD